MQFSWTFWLAVACSLFAVTGCGTATPEAEPEPETLSFKEALEIYNQELETLDRLRAERTRLQETLKPDPTDLVGDLLGQARDAQAELEKTLDDLGDPIGQPAAGDTEDSETPPNAFDALEENLNDARRERDNDRQGIVEKIAQLDKDIAEQELRVSRAKADRDAADASRQ